MKVTIFKKIVKCFFVLLLSMCFFGCSSDVSTGQERSSSSINTTIDGNNKSDGESDNKPARTNNVTVKYRDTPVDIASPYFEYVDTTGSSFIRGAWYDKQNNYLVMNIDGTYYNYCGVPESVWRGFKESESYGRYFNASIKESFEYKNCVGPDY